MWMKFLFLFMLGSAYGLLAAAGVFTVLTAVGLVPRFAGKTHTANKLFLFEEMVIGGTIFGCFISVFPEYSRIGWLLQQVDQGSGILSRGAGSILQVIIGLFSGMFIGCLALAIAEMVDSIPIFARRISFRHGLGLAVLCMALGKLCGSVLYFSTGLREAAK